MNSKDEIVDKIVVGLCTFRRNKQLQEAIDSLSQIKIPDKTEVVFILVDNDENAGAKSIFDAYFPDLPFFSYYFVEKNRGLACVRNRVLDAAISMNASIIAMFDDDEIVTEEWLVELYKALKMSQSDGVSGTVYRSLPLGSSDLIKSLWKNSKPPAGTIALLQTGNCMFMANIIRPDGLNIRFDPSFNFSGREDVVFSFDAQLKEIKFASATEAIVIEKFPKERATFRYLLKRWFETGTSDIAIARHYKFDMKIRTLKELSNIAMRLLMLPFIVFCGLKRSAKIVLKITASCGWICGLFGKTTTYYLKHKD